jgi:hypothetical protein
MGGWVEVIAVDDNEFFDIAVLAKVFCFFEGLEGEDIW